MQQDPVYILRERKIFVDCDRCGNPETMIFDESIAFTNQPDGPEYHDVPEFSSVKDALRLAKTFFKGDGYRLDKTENLYRKKTDGEYYSEEEGYHANGYYLQEIYVKEKEVEEENGNSA